MPFTSDTFTHLFSWDQDPQRQEKIINARLEAEFDGIDTALSSLANGTHSMAGIALDADAAINWNNGELKITQDNANNRIIFDSSSTITTQPLWDIRDNSTTAGGGYAMRWFGQDTNGDLKLGAVINGGLSDDTAGARKGAVDFVVYGDPGNTVLAHAGFTGDGSFPGFIPASNDAYYLGSTGARWKLNASTIDANGACTFSTTASAGTPVTLVSTNDNNVAGPILLLYRNSPSPAANDSLGYVQFAGEDSAGGIVEYASFIGRIIDPTDGSEDGELRIATAVSGTTAFRWHFGNGFYATAATGGDKGAGTINVSGDIYKNNTAYTNPDFVFEQFYTGKIEKFKDSEGAADYAGLTPLKNLRDYTSKHLRLPGISDEPMGAFDRADKALEKIEELTLYILELHERIAKLESIKA